MKEQILRARIRKRLTQRDAATKLEISAVHLCNIEKGRSDPSLKVLRKMAAAYGVRLTTLLNRE